MGGVPADSLRVEEAPRRPDWDELIEEKRRPFGLFTVCPDPAPEAAAWAAFADHCVQRELRLTVSWGPNSQVLEDAFDDAYLRRSVDGLTSAQPRTASGGEDPLEDEFEGFLASLSDDLRRLDDDAPPPDWVRVALIVGDEHWLHRVRAAIAELRKER